MSGQSTVVVEMNVLIAGLRSRQGVSFKLLSLIGSGSFDIALSVPLALEYEEVLRRQARPMGLSISDVTAIIDYLCSVAEPQEIFYLWRPLLRDPKDDLVLEVAVAGNCEAIITYNRRHFEGVGKFGVRIYDPPTFLREIGVL